MHMKINEIKGFILLLGTALCVLYSSAFGAEPPGTCVSEEEARLLDAVNAYRDDNGLAHVAWSKSLMTVAQWHAWDAGANSPFNATCNRHSWSDARPDLWTEVCYTPDHANAEGVWFKPREITGNIYTAASFENAAWGYLTPEAALNGWKNSIGHNNVILNRDIWTRYTWRAMGVGVNSESNYYFLWFSDRVDPQGTLSVCGEGLLFTDGFEP